MLQILEKFLCDILAAAAVVVAVVVVAMDPGKPSDDIWFPAEERNFSLSPQNIQPGPGIHTVCYRTRTHRFSPETRQPGIEADKLPLLSVRLRMTAPSYAFKSKIEKTNNNNNRHRFKMKRNTRIPEEKLIALCTG